MYEILAHSQVTLQPADRGGRGIREQHGPVRGNGVGTMLLTDDGKNLSELFRRAEEVVSYANEDDAARALRRFVENKDERLRIAEAGQARTLNEHTYARRIPELVELLESRLK